MHISSTDGLIIPVGTTGQRPGTATTGTIRYNATTSQFEGFGTASWGSLGGLIDVDQDTYISAETSPGADNDELRFFTAGTERMRILITGNVGVGNTASTALLDVNNTTTITITAAANARVLNVQGAFTEAASGVHARIAGFEITPPTITAGVATVTDTASLYISA
ncbi:MAG: Baseplate wedge initiator, partial [Parcubacteria group bacterium Greene0714_21]